MRTGRKRCGAAASRHPDARQEPIHVGAQRGGLRAQIVRRLEHAALLARWRRAGRLSEARPANA
jgi:hypothetical protein